MADGRNKNNMSLQQRRAINRGLRRRKIKAPSRDRLEAAKTVLRRTCSEVYDASIDDPRFKGWVRVGTRKYRPAEVIKMAADVLRKESTRQRELRALYGLSNAGRKR
jgi:hypothetical protein